MAVGKRPVTGSFHVSQKLGDHIGLWVEVENLLGLVSETLLERRKQWLERRLLSFESNVVDNVCMIEETVLEVPAHVSPKNDSDQLVLII